MLRREGGRVGRFGAEHGTDGEQAAAERLGQHHHVGDHPLGLAGEQVAGAAEAGLDLVEGQEDARLAADRADLGEVAGGRLHDAALALDRLDEEGRVMPRPIGQGPAQCVHVAVGHLIEVHRRRAEAALVVRVAGGGERPERLAVEAPVRREDAERAPWRPGRA